MGSNFCLKVGGVLAASLLMCACNTTNKNATTPPPAFPPMTGTPSAMGSSGMNGLPNNNMSAAGQSRFNTPGMPSNGVPPYNAGTGGMQPGFSPGLGAQPNSSIPTQPTTFNPAPSTPAPVTPFTPAGASGNGTFGSGNTPPPVNGSGAPALPNPWNNPPSASPSTPPGLGAMPAPR